MKTPEGRHIRERNTYGNIRVISLQSCDPKTRYFKYKCECLNCGHPFVTGSQQISNYAKNNSCPECSKRRKIAERDRDVIKHIGEHYRQLEIVDYAGLKCASKKSSYATPYMICKCHKCGSTTEIPLVRLTSGQASECVNCMRGNLKKGREQAKEYAKGGSSPLNIVEREINKNNTSGHKGVSWHGQMQKWRAYIAFQRRQYSLGLYDNIEDAVAARKEGEEEIFGNFIEWYKENYPTQWERLQKKKKT